jgi:hypothetical protein
MLEEMINIIILLFFLKKIYFGVSILNFPIKMKYEIIHKIEKGNGLYCTSDIEKGEIILSEYPFSSVVLGI